MMAVSTDMITDELLAAWRYQSWAKMVVVGAEAWIDCGLIRSSGEGLLSKDSLVAIPEMSHE